MGVNTQAMNFLFEGSIDAALRTLLFHYQSICADPSALMAQLEQCVQPSRGHASFRVEALSLEDVFDWDAEVTARGNASRMYDYVFVVEALSASESPLSTAATSAVILYNLAILVHLKEPTGRQDSLCKALELYNRAASILRRLPPQSNLQELELALYCNMGHVYASFQNAKAVENCQKELEQRLSRLDLVCLPPRTFEFFEAMIESFYDGQFHDRAAAA
jgi:hypothetical protein